MTDPTLSYIRHTCPIVDKIINALEGDIEDVFLWTDEDKETHSRLSKKINRLIDDAGTDIKNQTTIPFREAFKSAYEDWRKAEGEYLDKINSLDAEVEELKQCILDLEENE